MSHSYGHPLSQNIASGRRGPQPGLVSQHQYPINPPLLAQQDSGFAQVSAPFPRQIIFPAPSQYTQNENPQNPALIQSHPLQQYAGSQAVHQHSIPSFYTTMTTPKGHPVSNQTYSERENTISFRGIGGPFSGDGLCNHTGDNSGWYPTNGLAFQHSSGSPIEPYYPNFEEHGYIRTQSHCTEQSSMNQTKALPGLEPWIDPPVQYSNAVTYENSGPGGMKSSFLFRSATNNHGWWRH